MPHKEKVADEIQIGDYVYHGEKRPKVVIALAPAYVQFTSLKEKDIPAQDKLKDPDFLKTCYWVNRNEIQTVKNTINIFKK